MLSDDEAEKHEQIRVIDESGEDCLYLIATCRSIDNILYSRPDPIFDVKRSYYQSS